ncbi:glycosyltransferase family 4 protein [Planctomycetota bacterium]
MKIILLSNTSWYIYNFRKNLIRMLQKDGNEVIAVAPYDDYVDKLSALGVKHYTLILSRRGKNPFKEVFSCYRLLGLLRDIKPDVVLSFTVKCNLYAGICRRFLKFEQIANISGLGEAFEKKGLISFIVSCIYKWALNKSRRAFFQNDEDMKVITERGLLSEKMCKCLPGSGVDLRSYRPACSIENNKRRIFFMFGRLVPKKGYDLFMKAAENICLSGKYNAEFWIMGIVDESRRESEKLFKRILALQRKGIIKYLSPSDEVEKVLQQVDVVVLPSKYNEGVPRSLLEAMACGKPIITTAWKGCRNTVDHGRNGYLVKVDDYDALEHYMVKLLNAPQQQLRMMGKASRQKAENQFDENYVLAAYRQEICNELSPKVKA